MVANWLHGVARQTALKARATAARRKTREKQVAKVPEPAVMEQEVLGDLQALLDEAVSRLPDKYRVVVVLCDLEGKSRKEAARELGWPEGTVAGRLARARAMLAKWLARYGPAVSGGALAALLSPGAAAPAAVVSSTIQAANLLASGTAVSSGLISAKVIALTEGVVKTMLASKIKSSMAVALVVGLVFSGAGTGLMTGVLGAPQQAGTQAAKQPEEQQGAALAPHQNGRDTDVDQDRYRALEKRVEELSKQVEQLRQELLKRDEPNRLGNKEGPSTKRDSRFPDGREYDFGKVRRGTLVRHYFHIVNTTDAPLRLTSVRVSAACLTGSVNKEVLAPREKALVKISVDTGPVVGPTTVVLFLRMEQEGIIEEVRFSITGTSENAPPDHGPAVPGATPHLSPPEVTINHRHFKVPFQVGRTQVKKVTLLLSSNGGRTWERGETVSPDDKAFNVVVPDDGEFLFAVETEDTTGRSSQGPPVLKIIIDTKGNKD
jgi:hypothetical protein